MTVETIVTDNGSDAFWEGVAAGELLLPRAPLTGACQWYPRGGAIKDQSVTREWFKASRNGRVFSFTEMHRGPAPHIARLNPPVVLGLIELEEGPLMLMHCKRSASGRLAVGMRGRVGFRRDDHDRPLPFFEVMD